MLTLPDGEVLVGRDESCRIRLGSSDVSRKHCRLTASAEGVVAEDLGSRNGTYVNDLRIDGPVTLQPGDILRVGPLVFEVPGGTSTSEDDIVDWLSGVEDTTGPTDTTILPGRAKQKEPTPDVPPPSKETFDSVAEEAADIIRRHRLMEERKQSNPDASAE